MNADAALIATEPVHIPQLSTKRAITSCSISPCGRLLMAVTGNTQLHIIDLLLGEERVYEGPMKAACCQLLGPDAAFICKWPQQFAVVKLDHVRRTAVGKEQKLRHNEKLKSNSRDGQYLLVGDDTQTDTVYRLADMEEVGVVDNMQLNDCFQVLDDYFYFVNGQSVWMADLQGNAPIVRYDLGIFYARNANTFPSWKDEWVFVQVLAANHADVFCWLNVRTGEKGRSRIDLGAGYRESGDIFPTASGNYVVKDMQTLDFRRFAFRTPRSLFSAAAESFHSADLPADLLPPVPLAPPIFGENRKPGREPRPPRWLRIKGHRYNIKKGWHIMRFIRMANLGRVPKAQQFPLSCERRRNILRLAQKRMSLLSYDSD